MGFHLFNFRPCGTGDYGYVYAYISDLDAPELCTLPSNREASPLPYHGTEY